MATYKRFPETVLTTSVKVFIRSQGPEPYATLHTAGAGSLGEDLFGVPGQDFSVTDALSRGKALADRYAVPLFVQVDAGAVWDVTWGDLQD